MNSFIQENKKYFYYFPLTFIFILLIGRFFYLQIYKQAAYFRESERNRIREVVIDPPRGLMIDRDGEILVDNRPAHSLFAIPFELQQAESTYSLLSSILGLETDELRQKIKREQKGAFIPVKVKRQIDFVSLSWIEEHKLDLPGIIYKTEPRRSYPSGVKAPHIFGYLGEITKDELDQLEAQGYRLGDIIGKKGLEKEYESQLKGQKGVSYVEVDAFGREIRTLTEKGEVAPRPGKNLILTLDADLQRFIEIEMANKKGGAVVLDVRNGEVLALVSKPDYDPEVFSRAITPEIWLDLVNDPDKPLYDRMIQSFYPPGSTFKLVLAIAALEEDKLSEDWKVFCPGYFKLGWKSFDCWRAGGHGEVNLMQAIEQSCNVYFYKLGLIVGLKDWAKYARLVGFGQPTGIDLLGESAGLVPDSTYFDSKYGKGKWTQGLVVNLAVGQGDLLVTPIQMATLAMIIANNGISYRPHLVKYIEDPENGVKTPVAVNSTKINGISLETFKTVKAGMFRVVHGEKGTGRGLWLPNLLTAGKTGTAQNPHGEDHAWFIGFAPFYNPEIAFCVFVENGGTGGAVAVPIARGILKQYFSNSKFEVPPKQEEIEQNIDD